MTNMNIDMLTQNAAAWAKTVTVGENLVLCKVMGSVMMYVDPRDQSIAPHLMINGLWEPNVTIAIAKYVKRGMHCLDVGANVGYFSILMASSGASVDAFEPNPMLARLLNMTTEINGYLKRITVHSKVVSDYDGVAQLNISTSCNGGSSIISQPNGYKPYPCEAVKLDTYCKSEIDFIKCDVEKADILVWKGMQRIWKENRQIQGCFESLGSPEERASLYESLSDNGANWVGIINPVGSIVPIDLETIIASESADMLWVRHRSDIP